MLACWELAASIRGFEILAAPNPQVKSGVDRQYVIDCGDRSGTDESHWTPRVDVGTRVGFPGHFTSSTMLKGGSCGTRVLTTL